jgi:phage recombination protein Bet
VAIKRNGVIYMSEELTVTYNIGDNEIKLTPTIVKKFITGNNADITLSEFKMFTELCKVQKLNPFLREAYCIKFGTNPAQIVVGKDAIIKRAIHNPQYNGMESGVIVIESETGKEVRRDGGFFLEGTEQLVGGWARVYRKDWAYPIYISVSLNEVAQKKKDGNLNSNWASKPATMIEKVAKVRALREAFTDDLQGMYEAEEFGNSSTPIDTTSINSAELVNDLENLNETEQVKE